MPILLSCPSCQRKLKLPDQAAGKKGQCPSCQTRFPVPEQAPPPIEEEIAPPEDPVSEPVAEMETDLEPEPEFTPPAEPEPEAEAEPEFEEEVEGGEEKKELSDKAAKAAVAGGIGLVSALFGRIAEMFGSSGPGKEEANWLKRIALDPDNAELRLEFADWLEKKRNPQGEFIRIDHELETLPPDDESREELDHRWSELLDAHGKRWLGPLRKLGLEPQIAGHVMPALWMHHGILDEVQIDRDGILPRNAAKLFRAVPGLQRLDFASCRMVTKFGRTEFIDYKPDIPGIVKLKEMEQISSLSLSSMQLTLEDAEAIVTSERLANLRELDLGYNSLGPDFARILAEAGVLTRLRRLVLRGCDLGEEGGLYLASWEHLGSVRELVLGNNRIGPQAAAALLASPKLGELKELDLDENDLGIEGAKAAASCARLAALKTLSLKQNQLTAAGVAVLAKSPHLGQLTALYLSNNNLDSQAVAALARGPFSKLETLDLDWNDQIGPRGGSALAGALANLKELSMSRTGLGDAGVEALAGSALRKLTKLQLGDNNLSAAGVQALAKSPVAAGLTELNLGSNKFGDEGAKALSRSPHLRNIRYLYVSDCDLGDDGQDALRERFGDKVSM